VPAATACVADSVVQAGGIVGTAGRFESPAPHPVAAPPSPVVPASAPPVAPEPDDDALLPAPWLPLAPAEPPLCVVPPVELSDPDPDPLEPVSPTIMADLPPQACATLNESATNTEEK
jgi:hypothetical protein